MPSQKSTMWIGTLNNPDENNCEAYLESWKDIAVFTTGQLEKGAEGTPHLQFFIHCKKQTCLP